MLIVDSTLKDKKEELLDYFRNRAQESVEKITKLYGVKDYKERASAINKAVAETKNDLVKALVDNHK